MPRLLLHLEGFAVFVAATAFFFHLGGGWLLYLLLLLAPDLSMLGYLAGVRVGSISYNLAHTYVFPVLLLSGALAGGWALGQHLGLLWLAHIGMDRMLGYGLKYPTHFKDTHLQRVANGAPEQLA